MNLKHTTLACLLFLANQLCQAQTFTKITTGPFVTTTGDSRSVNWIDVNNDGFIDCMITNGPAGGQNNMLYINDGAGGFTAVVNDTIVKDHKPSDGATWADTDNDGDLDCFVANWYPTTNLFYINNGNGTFIQPAIGVVQTSGGYCETASWGDYDNDGLVDLYVTNSAATNKNLLYHNDGTNNFTRILSGDMVTDSADTRSANWTDIDSDGDLDLFVTNESSANECMYRNDGAGIFTKITSGPLVTNGGNTMSSSWADIDNDGDLDVFLANDLGDNSLFRNDGNFNFVKITSDTVSDSNGNSFSSAFSDVDNDGDLDLFVTNSFHTATLQFNFMYLNNGNGTFTRISNTAPATELTWAYGCAFGDYDNDGFEDLAVATVRFNGQDKTDLLYHNNGNSNHWITIKLTGIVTNRSAIGTKVRAHAIINGVSVWQMREISAQSGYCSQNDLRVHFGLGDAVSADTIIIEWLSGEKDTCTNINADQFYHVTEGGCLTVLGINNPVKNENEIQLTISPNPTKQLAEFSYCIIKESQVLMTLYDSSGKKIKTLVNSKQQPGNQHIKLDTSLLHTGNYICELLIGGKKVSQKMLVVAK